MMHPLPAGEGLVEQDRRKQPDVTLPPEALSLPDELISLSEVESHKSNHDPLVAGGYTYISGKTVMESLPD
jgi:hypothetical protein